MTSADVSAEKARVEENLVRGYDLEEQLIAFAAAVCRTVEDVPSTRVGGHAGGQLIRCATATAANYGEAQGAESRKDFVHKMRLCLKELRETLVWLKFLQRFSIGSANEIEAGIQESNELIAIFVKSIATAQRYRNTRS